MKAYIMTLNFLSGIVCRSVNKIIWSYTYLRHECMCSGICASGIKKYNLAWYKEILF